MAERFSALNFLIVSIWIFLFSVPFELINLRSFFDVLKIFLLVLSLQLYDDVVQSEDDSLVKLKLPLVLLLCLSALSWITDGIDLCMLWVYFFVLNHILYKALAHRNFWMFVLPALQYPVFVLALTYRIWRGKIDKIYVLSAISIFLFALVFRWLEQSENRLQPIWLYLFSSIILAINVWNFTTVLSLVVAVGALFCLISLFLLCKVKMHLWWALIVLLMHVVAFNFGF